MSDDLSTYADSSEVADWSNAAVKWAVSAGLLQGRNNNFLAPGEKVTRGEVAAILTRFITELFLDK